MNGFGCWASQTPIGLRQASVTKLPGRNDEMAMRRVAAAVEQIVTVEEDSGENNRDEAKA